MPIFRGTNKIGTLFFGGNKIGKAYLGTNLVYQSMRAIYLGYGTSFTVTASIYKNYSSLVANDFFITPTEGSLITSSNSCGCWNPEYAQGTLCKDANGNTCCSGTLTDSISFSKTWNASTGVFNCSFGGQKVYVWIIPNSTQLISSGIIKSLGSGQTFNVQSIASDYASCTKNNFLFRTLNGASSTFYCCSYNCENGAGFEKSYSNGTLTAKNTVRRNLGSGSLNQSPFYIPTTLIH